MKLDSDYGLSLEHTPAFENDFKVDRYLQFYLAQDRVNGEICAPMRRVFPARRSATR